MKLLVLSTLLAVVSCGLHKQKDEKDHAVGLKQVLRKRVASYPAIPPWDRNVDEYGRDYGQDYDGQEDIYVEEGKYTQQGDIGKCLLDAATDIARCFIQTPEEEYKESKKQDIDFICIINAITKFITCVTAGAA